MEYLLRFLRFQIYGMSAFVILIIIISIADPVDRDFEFGIYTGLLVISLLVITQFIVKRIKERNDKLNEMIKELKESNQALQEEIELIRNFLVL